MGTNYYVKTERKGPCPTCGHEPDNEPLHIGKSSAGWKFLFAPYPELGLTSWAAWQAYLRDKTIEDEYGQELSLDALQQLVLSKQDGIDATNASPVEWGPFRRDMETSDAEGFRFCETAHFS